MGLGLVLAVLTALSNAASNVLQRLANKQQACQDQGQETSAVQLVWELLHRKLWLAGFGAVLTSFLLQAAALHFAQLALVQPIVVLELPLTLVAGSMVFRVALHRREWAAVGAMTVGLGLLTSFLDPGGGSNGHAGTLAWVVGVGSSTAGMAILVAVGSRASGPRQAALLGAAAGIGFGLTAALMKATVDHLGGGAAELFTSWTTYALAVSGVSALVLTQEALRAGPLVAAQPGITLLDPFTSIVWGVFAFHEGVRAGPLLAIAAVGAILMVLGAVVLSGSPLLEQTQAPDDAPVPAATGGAAGGQRARTQHQR